MKVLVQPANDSLDAIAILDQLTGTVGVAVDPTASGNAWAMFWEADSVALQVEVFPQEPYCWIAVIEVPNGPFSTETTSAADVPRDVEASIKAVLGLAQLSFDLVDDLGHTWSPLDAPAQAQRLDIVFDERTWLPARRRWWQRLLGRRSSWPIGCPACGHDWREHDDSDQECAECRRKIEQQASSAPTAICRLMPSAEVRLAASCPA